VTLADFYNDGVWDCQHAYDAGLFQEVWQSLGCPSDPVAVCRRVEELDFTESADWIGQQDEFGGLDPLACWEAWKRGWMDQAARSTAYFIPRWRD
jgi:hypothetical protein